MLITLLDDRILKTNISSNELPCYKIILREFWKYYTPYRYYPVEFDVELKSRGEKHISYSFLHRKYYTDGRGFFHTFVDYESAVHEANFLRSAEPSCLIDVIIAECVIPKGAIFYKCTTDLGLYETKTYASDKLIIKNEKLTIIKK